MTDLGEADREGGPSLWAGQRFYRGHGLGNDYIVFEAVEPQSEGWAVSSASIGRVCRRGTGIGSDGLMVLLQRTPIRGAFPVRGFNPDGTEFERSGNGLRVLASYLFREGLVGDETFSVSSGGSSLAMTVHAERPHGVHDISVEMGRANVGLKGVQGDPQKLDGEGRAVHPTRGPIPFVPISVGNPHAVVFSGTASESELEEVGPFLARHPAFVRGANVQLADVIAPNRVRIAIWERGVGQTSASGTSSCASVAAAVSVGRLAPGHVTVEMEGGTLLVSITENLELTLRGPVHQVAAGRLTDGFTRGLSAST